MAARTDPKGGSSVLRSSASTGILKPMRAQDAKAAKGHGHHSKDDDDPVLAVLNRSWTKAKEADSHAEEDAGGGRHGNRLARKRATMPAHMMHTGKDGDPAEHSQGLSRFQARQEAEAAVANAGAGRLHRPGNLTIETGKKDRGDTLPVEFRNGIKDLDQLSPLVPIIEGPLAAGGGVRGSGPRQRRAWSINIASTDTEEMSPKWHMPANRRGSNKLSWGDHAEENLARVAEEGQAAGSSGSAPVCADQEMFQEVASKLRTMIGQTTVRMNDHLVLIRRQMEEDKERFVEGSSGLEVLTEISFLVATSNYRLQKWIYQLEGKKGTAPIRPTHAQDCTAVDLVSEVQYALSRMEVCAGSLTPMLQKIVHDAKNMRRQANGEPLTPTAKNPAKLAIKRGFQDLEEMRGLAGHLEHLLEVTGHLAHRRKKLEAAQQVRASIKAIQAVGRFKRILKKNREAKDSAPGSPASQDAASPKADGDKDAAAPVRSAANGMLDALGKLGQEKDKAKEPEKPASRPGSRQSAREKPA